MVQRFMSLASSFLLQKRKGDDILRTLLLVAILPLFVWVLLAASAKAEKAKVTVDLGKTVNILTNTSIALPASMFDGDAFQPASARFTGLSGATVIRYPGGAG